MCWDIETSLTTLAIGTVFNAFNVYKFSKSYPQIVPISVVFQWTLLMQLFEAMAWYSQKNPDMNSKAAEYAMVANVTQPIVTVFILLVCMSDLPIENKAVAVGAVFAYTCWLLLELNNQDKFKVLKPKHGCEHLDLVWWSKFRGKCIPYLVVLFTVLILLLRPVNDMVVTTSYIFISLVLSYFIYPCGTGSMWCWFAAFAPVFMALYFYTK